MYDLSGGLEAAGKPMYDVLNFAVDEMNAAGGLLGRPIKVVSFDTQTNMQLYAQYAQEAALKDKVAVVHGGITSASREVIRPVLDKYKTLYFYDMPYEGGVCDRNIFIDGVTPAHNTEVLVNYGLEELGQEGVYPCRRLQLRADHLGLGEEIRQGRRRRSARHRILPARRHQFRQHASPRSRPRSPTGS